MNKKGYKTEGGHRHTCSVGVMCLRRAKYVTPSYNVILNGGRSMENTLATILIME